MSVPGWSVSENLIFPHTVQIDCCRSCWTWSVFSLSTAFVCLVYWCLSDYLEVSSVRTLCREVTLGARIFWELWEGSETWWSYCAEEEEAAASALILVVYCSSCTTPTTGWVSCSRFVQDSLRFRQPKRCSQILLQRCLTRTRVWMLREELPKLRHGRTSSVGGRCLNCPWGRARPPSPPLPCHMSTAGVTECKQT
jgi:hypothetical protein